LHRKPATSPAYWLGWGRLRAMLGKAFHAVFVAVSDAKRTFLYGTVAYMRNSGNSNFSLIASSCDATNPLTGESQTGAYVGIMHNF
ncbi:MAG: hypothetical protein VB141_09460, partial [Burkholderia gladioli]